MAESSGIPKTPTPLWVISLFVSLTEIIAGIAVTQAKGGVQVALTAFVMLFPILIAAAFFVTLWVKNYVFWPPGEFGSVDVAHYVEAMQRRSIDQNRIHEIVRESVASAFAGLQVTVIKELGVAPQTAQEVAEKLVDVALAKIDQTIVSVNTATLPGTSGEVLAIPYDPEQPMYLFLDDIWFAISNVVGAYSYGKKWVVRDTVTKAVFLDAGRPWAQRNGHIEDIRPLREVGVFAGSRLEVVRP